MKKILLLGAGLSSSTLIRYFLDNASKNNWKIRVGDISEDSARQKLGGHPRGEAFSFDVNNPDDLEREIVAADIVVSLLPARLHFLVAQSCVKNRRNMVTASYVSKEIQKLDKDAKANGVLLMNEVGVDPGIDHMSAMQVIDRIRDDGDSIISFESATGGLVAPNYDTNPWRYKFTWAPRNVVLAGQGGARFYHNGKFKYIPYHKIFERKENIEIPGYGQFEVYANRDSLKYREAYGLSDLLTMFRGTIRRPGFCEAWNLLVQLGATDDSYIMDDSKHMTYRDFTNSFLAFNIVDPVESKLAAYLGIKEDSSLMKQLEWLGLFDDDKVIDHHGYTPAQCLQHILEQKWQLDPGDKDMIVMEHQFDYMHIGSHRKLFSTMVFIGEDQVHTAMSITVGLPVAITTKLILEGKIGLTGVQIPVDKQVYEPVLEELREYGIVFQERDFKLS
ncbi:MAG: saccharopine dehydrogenase NADP-binding domain-containing protein [Bacteroidales bacterium]|nr:saccharopine dehydrogenase NADP-binding domain-containing protein [Bacteroidales bacterium]MCB9013549.1 saccharopine dehydrogenase NADP-binding domain-containing protein [Bacteroidales bacterium]